jgi:hypothetical protein
MNSPWPTGLKEEINPIGIKSFALDFFVGQCQCVSVSVHSALISSQLLGKKSKNFTPT